MRLCVRMAWGTDCTGTRRQRVPKPPLSGARRRVLVAFRPAQQLLRLGRSCWGGVLRPQDQCDSCTASKLQQAALCLPPLQMLRSKCCAPHAAHYQCCALSQVLRSRTGTAGRWCSPEHPGAPPWPAGKVIKRWYRPISGTVNNVQQQGPAQGIQVRLHGLHGKTGMHCFAAESHPVQQNHATHLPLPTATPQGSAGTRLVPGAGAAHACCMPTVVTFFPLPLSAAKSIICKRATHLVHGAGAAAQHQHVGAGRRQVLPADRRRRKACRNGMRNELCFPGTQVLTCKIALLQGGQGASTGQGAQPCKPAKHNQTRQAHLIMSAVTKPLPPCQPRGGLFST